MITIKIIKAILIIIKIIKIIKIIVVRTIIIKKKKRILKQTNPLHPIMKKMFKQ
jgi:hypothetical protein